MIHQNLIILNVAFELLMLLSGSTQESDCFILITKIHGFGDQLALMHLLGVWLEYKPAMTGRGVYAFASLF